MGSNQLFNKLKIRLQSIVIYHLLVIYFEMLQKDFKFQMLIRIFFESVIVMDILKRKLVSKCQAQQARSGTSAHLKFSSVDSTLFVTAGK